jgi:hypothetical protein
MRLISENETGLVAGGYGIYEADLDSMIQGAVDANNAWLDANPVQIEIFTIGNFTLSYSGSITEGLLTSAQDCAFGAGGVKLTNDFAITSGYTWITSSQAAVVGCTVGVGGGIIRDLMP